MVCGDGQGLRPGHQLRRSSRWRRWRDRGGQATASGCFLDFHAPVTSGEAPGPSRRLPMFDAHERRDPRLVGAVTRTPTGATAIPARCRCWTSTSRPSSGWSTGCSRGRAGGRELTECRDGGAARGVRDRPRPQVHVASLDEACRGRRTAGLGRRAEGDGAGGTRPARPGQRPPQHRRSPRRWPRLGRSDRSGPRPGPAGRRRPDSRRQSRRPGDGPAGRRPGGRQPRGRRVRPDRLPGSGRHRRASCWATSSIGCRR